MLLANETVAAHLVAHDVPALHRVHEAPDVKKVAEFEAFIEPLGYGLGATGHRHAEALPEADRSHPRHARGASDCGADAADDAEGAVRRGQPRTLRSRGGALHALHLADPALSGSRRAPHAARVTPRGDDRTHGARSCDEELPEIARHTSEMERRADEAERELLQWKKVRFMADKVGDEYEGYITGVAPFGLFIELIEHYRRRAASTSRAWPTTTTGSSSSSTCCAARTRRRSTGSATRCASRSCASTWSGVRSIWGWWRFSETVRREERRRGATAKQGRGRRRSAPANARRREAEAKRPRRAASAPGERAMTFRPPSWRP